MDLLGPFWRHLELWPHAAETRVEWRRVLGSVFPSVAEHLTSTGRFASFVASPRHNAPDMRVVRYRDGSLAAVCDAGDTPTLTLTPDDLALMTVATRSLRVSVSRALGLRTSTVTAEGLPGILRIGTWVPQPETAFPVVIAAHPDEQQFGMLVKETVLAADRPVLVLTPTAETWTDELLTWCATHRAMLGSLLDLVGADADGVWAATEAWDPLIEAFERRAGFTRQAGTQNKRPRRKRGDFLAKVDAIGRELVLEAESRVNLVKFAYAEKQTPSLPPITKAEICSRADARDYDFSRAAADPAGDSFNRIFDLLHDPDGLLRWWANHRRVTPACS